MQTTVSKTIQLSGVGLHSGCRVKMSVLPAPADTGIVFRRVDLPGKPEIRALYSNVVNTQNCTCLGDEKGNLVSTVEHVMAALSVRGVDNAVIEVNGQELPIMDGSGKFFYDALKATELKDLTAPRMYLKVKREVSFTDKNGNTVSLKPAESFVINFAIDFPSKIVGHQIFSGEITPEIFEKDIAPSRTFCEKYQVDYLRSVGLVKGGSLDNAVVLDGETILNPGGFRVQNECVNHKVMDAVGDLYTSGYHLIGELTASRTGHYHNNELLKVLFADKSNYELV